MVQVVGGAVQLSGSKQNFYDVIADIYDDLFDTNPFYERVVLRERELFNHYVSNGFGHRALDIGCGTGFHTKWLVEKGYETLGIDTSPSMIAVALAKSRNWLKHPEFMLCDGQDLKAVNDNFHVITCLGSTLNHIKDWNALISTVSAHLETRGTFLFSFDYNSPLESLYWLLKRRANVYEDSNRFKSFFDRVVTWATGSPYDDIWTFRYSGQDFPISLRYESIINLRRYLLRSGLRLSNLCGVHLLTYLRQNVMTASSVLEHERQERPSPSLIDKIDWWLSKRLPWLCVSIVGAAKKISQ